MTSNPFAAWPGNRRIAVAVTVMFETWADGKWPTAIDRHKLHNPDPQAANWARYGGHDGVWRLIRILDQAGVPATFCTSAKSAQDFPAAMRQIRASGHDVAAHNLTQDAMLGALDEPGQLAAIRQTVDVLEAASGQRPQGWLSAFLSWTEHTDRHLAEQGLLWRGDANYTDLPCRVETPAGPIAHIPHSDYTDHRVLWLAPPDYQNTYVSTFDYLYENEPMALLVITMHCHLGGRPLYAAAFQRVLRHIAAHEGVWFARHGELAEWALAQAKPVRYADRFFPDRR